jgi:hypothetical protein
MPWLVGQARGDIAHYEEDRDLFASRLPELENQRETILKKGRERLSGLSNLVVLSLLQSSCYGV